MKVYREFKPLTVVDRPCVFALGMFDGVHKGHQKLLDLVRKEAKARDFYSCVLTFSNHPFSILKKDEKPFLLSSEDEKCTLLEKSGVDILLFLPFTEDIRELSAVEFVEKLFQMVPVGCWVAGVDIGFGKNREGSLSYVEALSKKKGFDLIKVEKLTHQEEPVSSSRIRALIEAEKFEEAEALLGRTPH